MTEEEIRNRLEEIKRTSLEDLGDEAVLALLQERKNLLQEQEQLLVLAKKKEEEALQRKKEEEKRQEEAKKKELEEKRKNLTLRLQEVNKSITPDQDDEKLLSLIQERKVLEAELRVFTADPEPFPSPEGSLPEQREEKKEPRAPAEEKQAPASSQDPLKGSDPVLPETKPVKLKKLKPETVETPKPAPKSAPSLSSLLEKEEIETAKIAISPQLDSQDTNYTPPSGKVSELERTGERIAVDPSLQGTEYQGYLEELKANQNSLGTFLQGLPMTAKRNRAFMLEVAKIDPAYAMHYADKDTLKKDEAFNVAIAGMNNQRNTGNPLSEMLPEMRTGSVVLAGVKNDFRNVRFVRPEMPEYEEILALARKGALEAVASLKDAHDVRFLLPPILQKDKAFMGEVEKIISSA